MSFKISSPTFTPPRTPKKANDICVSPEDFQYDILEPNNILVAEGTIDNESWSDFAFAVGIPARGGQRFNASTQKLTQRMQKRKLYSAQQSSEYLKQFIENIVATCPHLSQQYRCRYHGDAVPSVEALKNTVRRLPTPKPAISVGYYGEAFPSSHVELQDGIISGPGGEPCNLKHVSQPVLGHFWPFFVVEVSDQSLYVARQASAVSAATCNNALDLLDGAAAIAGRDWNNSKFVFDRKFARSFSLSVHGKSAVLSVHSVQGEMVHVSAQVESYKLDDHNEVASLADRIQGIMVWGQYSRLGEIVSTLDQLGRKVHGNYSRPPLSGGMDGIDSSCLKSPKLRSPKVHSPRRPDLMKVVLRAGLPSWLSKP